jgi:periplasmic protein TonB
MTALALHLPPRRGLSRWAFAAATIVLAHALLVASIVLWYARRPVEPPVVLPAIAVSLLPVEASSPEIQNQDIAVGPAMQEAEETQKEPEKAEDPVEKSEQRPTAPQEADVALPQVQEKQIEEPKPIVQPPAPETRAPPKTEHVGQFTEASARAYNALVFGHMQRFKRYPASARGVSGIVVVRFELNRAGAVIGSAVTKSSGHAALDQEALDLLRRASPFPPFPAAKPGEQDSYVAPVNFSH